MFGKLQISILLIKLAVVFSSNAVQLPQLKPQVNLSEEVKQLSFTEKQTAKISVSGEGLATLKLRATENGAEIPFCTINDRHIQFQQFESLNIFPERYDDDGYAKKQQSPYPYTIAWTVLNPLPELNLSNLVSIDSRFMVHFYRLDPNQNKTLTIGLLNLAQIIKQQDGVASITYLAQSHKNIFVAYQSQYDENQEIKLIKLTYDTQKYAYQELKNVKLDLKNGILQDLAAFTHPTKPKEAILFVLQDQKLSAVYVQDGSIKDEDNLIPVRPITIDHADLAFIQIRLYVDLDSEEFQKSDKSDSRLHIYVLCQNNGLFKFYYSYNNPGFQNSPVFYDENLYIQVKNGELFNQFNGRIFFITTSDDLYKVREYERIINDNNSVVSSYYINRVHEVDHKVRDIVVYAYFIIILGSNSHTVSWHSVHPALEQSINKRQQFFTAFSLQSGVVVRLLNKTTNFYEPYFIGFQRRHIYMNRVVSVGAYLSCDPQSVSQDVVGDHSVSVSFFSYDFSKNNSYEVVENKANWILSVNRVYADTLAAGAIAGIVIACTFVLIVIIIVIYKKVKAQVVYKEVLQQEVDSFSQRRGSFNALRKPSNSEVPNNEGGGSPKQRNPSDMNFVTEPRQITENMMSQPNEDQIIKFQIDDDEE